MRFITPPAKHNFAFGVNYPAQRWWLFTPARLVAFAPAVTPNAPLRRQDAVLNYYRLGLSAKQIAAIMNISPSTVRAVKSLLRSGRRGASNNGKLKPRD